MGERKIIRVKADTLYDIIMMECLGKNKDRKTEEILQLKKTEKGIMEEIENNLELLLTLNCLQL